MSKGAASTVCGAMALLLTLGGMFLAGVPYVGALFAFAAPVVGLAGIVLGGLGIREAQATGGETGLPTTGVVLSVLGFLMGLVVALTCGLCNACVSARLGPAGRAVGDALAEARAAAEAEAARRRAQQQAQGGPGPLPGAAPDLGAALDELAARCTERTLSACAVAGEELHFTDLRCEAGGRCQLDFTLVRGGVTSEGSVQIAEADLLQGPTAYVPLVSDEIKEWRIAQTSAPPGP